MASGMTGFLFTLMRFESTHESGHESTKHNFFGPSAIFPPWLIVLWSSAPGWQAGQNGLWFYTVVKYDLLDWSDGPGDFAEENICYFLNFLLLKASTSCFGFVILLFWLRLFLLLAACVDLRDLVWTRCKLSIIFHQPLCEFWPCCCCTQRYRQWRFDVADPKIQRVPAFLVKSQDGIGMNYHNWVVVSICFFFTTPILGRLPSWLKEISDGLKLCWNHQPD